MTYKTIALRLLEANQELHERLRTSGTLLQTMERYASELKERHTSWMDTLTQERPGDNPTQITSRALELALQDIQERLSAESPPSATQEEALSLDDAMRFIRRHTPPA